MQVYEADCWRARVLSLPECFAPLIADADSFDPPSPLYKDEEDNSEDDDEFPSSQQR